MQGWASSVLGGTVQTDTPTPPVRAGDARPASHAFQFPGWLGPGVLFSFVKAGEGQTDRAWFGANSL